MTRSKFIGKVAEIIRLSIAFSEKARREGLLAMEDELEDMDSEFDSGAFKQGLRFAVDGVDARIIDEYLSNKVAFEKDNYIRICKTIIKRAVLGIQAGENIRSLFYVLCSYAGLSMKEESDIETALCKGPEVVRTQEGSDADLDDLDI